MRSRRFFGVTLLGVALSGVLAGAVPTHALWSGSASFSTLRSYPGRVGLALVGAEQRSVATASAAPQLSIGADQAGALITAGLAGDGWTLTINLQVEMLAAGGQTLAYTLAAHAPDTGLYAGAEVVFARPAQPSDCSVATPVTEAGGTASGPVSGSVRVTEHWCALITIATPPSYANTVTVTGTDGWGTAASATDRWQTTVIEAVSAPIAITAQPRLAQDCA